MQIIRSLIAAAVIALPTAAMAEAIPQSVITDYVGECVSSCSDSGTTSNCDQLCGCVGEKMGEQWTKEQYDHYSQVYASNNNDPEVQNKVNGLVQQCASEL
jgi:hypothetical protein